MHFIILLTRNFLRLFYVNFQIWNTSCQAPSHTIACLVRTSERSKRCDLQMKSHVLTLTDMHTYALVYCANNTIIWALKIAHRHHNVSATDSSILCNLSPFNAYTYGSRSRKGTCLCRKLLDFSMLYFYFDCVVFVLNCYTQPPPPLIYWRP